MAKYLSILLTVFFLGLLSWQTSSCKKEEIPEPEPVDSVRLDSSEVSYAMDVVKVLNNGNCTGCHSETAARGGVVLIGHEELKKWAENGRLLKSVRHEPGAVPMPLDRDKLTEERIWILERWVLQGLKDN